MVIAIAITLIVSVLVLEIVIVIAIINPYTGYSQVEALRPKSPQTLNNGNKHLFGKP